MTYFPVRKTKLQELHLFPNVLHGTVPKGKLTGRKLHIQRRFSTCHCWLKAAPQRGNVCSQGSRRAIVSQRGFLLRRFSFVNFAEVLSFSTDLELRRVGEGRAVHDIYSTELEHG